METRVCKKCGIEKNITAFGFRRAPNGTPYRRHTCSNCKSKKWRSKNPDKSKVISKRAKQKYQNNQPKMKITLLEYIEQLCCKECGFSEIEALCFHHRNPTKKSFDIKWGFTHSYSIDALKAEAKKCDILCANCHTILHFSGENCKRTEHRKRANQNLLTKVALMQAINQTKCFKCGFDKPQALAFHHKFDKKFTISEMMGLLPFNDLLIEAQKCDILCMNCHFICHSSI